MTSIRPTGIEHAASALRNIERRQEVIANNLANVSTAGFRGERVFSRLLANSETAIVGTTTDMRSGSMTTTGDPLDLAIDREGFFVVQAADGERWIRGGSLSIDERRLMVDATGNPLLGEDDGRGGVRGPITIPASAMNVQIDRDGAVIVDGDQVARLRLEQPSSVERLEHLGNGQFRPANAQNVEPELRTVRQGALEESNVQSLESMVDMIAIQRAYSSVQKVLTTIDSMCTIAATQIGRPS